MHIKNILVNVNFSDIIHTYYEGLIFKGPGSGEFKLLGRNHSICGEYYILQEVSTGDFCVVNRNGEIYNFKDRFLKLNIKPAPKLSSHNKPHYVTENQLVKHVNSKCAIKFYHDGNWSNEEYKLNALILKNHPVYAVYEPLVEKEYISVSSMWMHGVPYLIGKNCYYMVTGHDAGHVIFDAYKTGQLRRTPEQLQEEGWRWSNDPLCPYADTHDFYKKGESNG